jgi:hypothetical protein
VEVGVELALGSPSALGFPRGPARDPPAPAKSPAAAGSGEAGGDLDLDDLDLLRGKAGGMTGEVLRNKGLLLPRRAPQRGERATESESVSRLGSASLGGARLGLALAASLHGESLRGELQSLRGELLSLRGESPCGELRRSCLSGAERAMTIKSLAAS